MSTIDGQDLLGSGPHQWVWYAPQEITEKRIASAGTSGVVGIVTSAGAMPVRIEGLLRADDDATMNQLIAEIDVYIHDRTPVAWEDDQGQSGDYLVLMNIMKSKRTYDAYSGRVWMGYVITAEERSGSVN